MGNKFLDKQGLATFLAQSKELFATDDAVTEVKTTTDNYVLNVDYTPLRFDTSEIVSGGSAGGAECSGNHIIDVTELPTENIDQDAIYALAKEQIADIVLNDGNQTQLLKQLCSGLYQEPTFPTENIKVTENDFVYAYYIENKNDIFIYNGEEWYTLAMMFKNEITYQGKIQNASEAISVGYYALFTQTKQYYKYETYFNDVVLRFFATVIPFSSFITIYNGSVTYYYEKTKPTENIAITADTVFHMYYIEDENDILTYNGTEWERLSLVSSSDTFQGFIGDVSEFNFDSGYAAVGSNGWKRYISPVGIATITENSTVDVTDKKAVIVNVPTETVYGTWKFNDDVLDNREVDVSQEVIFTTCFEEGVEVICNKMRCPTSYKGTDPYHLFYYISEDGVIREKMVWSTDYASGGWQYESAKTVDFGKEPQLVTSLFKDWLVSNATKQPDSTECSGNHIIEVDTLPTENIDENAFYKVGDRYYKYVKELKDVFQDGFSFTSLIADGFDGRFYYVTAKEEVGNPIITDFSNGIVAFYYDDTAKDVFTYTGTEGTYTWNALGATTVTNENDIGGEGIYALIGGGLKEWFPASGDLKITKNGTYDVNNIVSAIVDVPNQAVVGVWRFNETLNLHPTEWDGQGVNFRSSKFAKYFEGMQTAESVTSNGTIYQLWYNVGYNSSVPYSSDTGWSQGTGVDEIDFGSEPQIVTSAFKEWLVANATPIYTITRTE